MKEKLRTFALAILDACRDLIASPRVEPIDDLEALLASTPREVVRTQTRVMPLSSVYEIKLEKVLPGKIAKVNVRPQWAAFQPKRIVIGDAPERWKVHDVLVGGRSQFAAPGEVPGEVFAAGAIGTSAQYETVQAAMDFTLLVEYIGPEPEGEVFQGAVVGEAVVH